MPKRSVFEILLFLSGDLFESLSSISLRLWAMVMHFFATLNKSASFVVNGSDDFSIEIAKLSATTFT